VEGPAPSPQQTAPQSEWVPSPAQAALPAQLGAKPGDAVLLLGLHLENIVGYLPMFSETGHPNTNLREGYATLVLHAHEGRADLVDVLPYLAVPQPAGFLYIGESSVSVHLPPDPKLELEPGTPMPRDYDATALWRTPNPKRIGELATELRARLKADQSWGKEDTTQLVFVTSRALCRIATQTEVTGGALWFFGGMTHAFEALSGPPIDSRLSRWVNETEMQAFANQAFADDGAAEPPHVDIRQTYEDPWGRNIDWKEDPTLCLTHRLGSVWVSGTVVRSGNSARSFSVEIPVMEAPATLAPGNMPSNWAALQAAFPEAQDAIVSPSHDLLLLLSQRSSSSLELVVWDTIRQKESSRHPWVGRIVMTEWAVGAAGQRWIRTLRH
jgi:hypothetical protein